jgi:polyphenol oxidase
MQKLSYIQPNWPAPLHIRAASTYRSGGVSRAPYDDFNLAAHVGDDSQAVEENRARLRSTLQLPNEPCWLQQVHSDKVIEARDYTSPPQADASVARESGVVCAVLTADCLPVLFCSRSGDRVAAAHAGWRGLAAGVLDNTVGALGLPGYEIIAWLGPAISQPAYEVGDDVRIPFLGRDSNAASAFKANSHGKWQCDLYELAHLNLMRLGIREIYGGDYCTYSDEDHFFSHRRDSQRAGQCGRMASLIWIDNT